MPYPDHFNANEYGFKEIVWTVPYKLLKFWAGNYVAIRQRKFLVQQLLEHGFKHDAIRAPRGEYDADKVADQIRALYKEDFVVDL